MASLKRCPRHDGGKGAYLPTTEFNKQASSKDGLQGMCRECAKAYQRERAADPKYQADREKYRKTKRAKTRRQQVMKRWHQANPEANHTYRARMRAAEAGVDVADSYTPEEWRELCEYYTYTCLCCLQTEPEIKLHADHVIPLTKGGSNAILNMQPLCEQCNKSKGIKIIDYRPRWERIVNALGVKDVTKQITVELGTHRDLGDSHRWRGDGPDMSVRVPNVFVNNVFGYAPNRVRVTIEILEDLPEEPGGDDGT